MQDVPLTVKSVTDLVSSCDRYHSARWGLLVRPLDAPGLPHTSSILQAKQSAALPHFVAIR